MILDKKRRFIEFINREVDKKVEAAKEELRKEFEDKLNHAISNLQDQINKTGMYDPDY